MFRIEQKGKTFDYAFCYTFSFFKEGKEKGKRIAKVMIKSHAFLLDQCLGHQVKFKSFSNMLLNILGVYKVYKKVLSRSNP